MRPSYDILQKRQRSAIDRLKDKLKVLMGLFCFLLFLIFHPFPCRVKPSSTRLLFLSPSPFTRSSLSHATFHATPDQTSLDWNLVRFTSLNPEHPWPLGCLANLTKVSRTHPVLRLPAFIFQFIPSRKPTATIAGTATRIPVTSSRLYAYQVSFFQSTFAIKPGFRAPRS